MRHFAWQLQRLGYIPSMSPTSIASGASGAGLPPAADGVVVFGASTRTRFVRPFIGRSMGLGLLFAIFSSSWSSPSCRLLLLLLPALLRDGVSGIVRGGVTDGGACERRLKPKPTEGTWAVGVGKGIVLCIGERVCSSILVEVGRKMPPRCYISACFRRFVSPPNSHVRFVFFILFVSG